MPPDAYLFLDIDGVLNSIASRTDPKHAASSLLEAGMPTAVHLAHLWRLVGATGCAIVLSSTWRLEAAERAAVETSLQSVGLALHDTTPVCKSSSGGAQARVREIKLWLQSAVPPEQSREEIAWLALDDLDMHGWCPEEMPIQNFQLTSEAVGLTSKNVDDAIAKLHGQQQQQQPQLAAVPAWVHARSDLAATLQAAVNWTAEACAALAPQHHHQHFHHIVARFLLATLDGTTPPLTAVAALHADTATSSAMPMAGPLTAAKPKERIASELAIDLTNGVNAAVRQRAAEPLKAIARHLLSLPVKS